MLDKLFKRDTAKEDSSDDLPVSLEAAIKGLTVFHRIPLEDKERVLLAFTGEQTASWYHTPEETRKRISEGWPGLAAAQLDRAMRAINGVIRAHSDANTTARSRSGWRSWKPIRSSIFPENNDYE